MYVLGQNDVLPCDVCEIGAATTHFFWLATFGFVGRYKYQIYA